jgi:hypothetical protein
MLNRNISQFVDASNLDLHSDLDVVWNVLSETENARIDDVVNELFIIQISSIPNHRSQKTNHRIDLKWIKMQSRVFFVPVHFNN